jgi:hypothetical protein
MASPKFDNRSEEFLGSLKNEHMKTHVVRDIFMRVVVLYEANRHVQHDEPCLATIYEYTSTNNVPTNTLERPAKWNSSWEANTEAMLVYGDVGYVE